MADQTTIDTGPTPTPGQPTVTLGSGEVVPVPSKRPKKAPRKPTDEEKAAREAVRAQQKVLRQVARVYGNLPVYTTPEDRASAEQGVLKAATEYARLFALSKAAHKKAGQAARQMALVG